MMYKFYVNDLSLIHSLSLQPREKNCMFISQELIPTNVFQQKEFVSLIFCVPLN